MNRDAGRDVNHAAVDGLTAESPSTLAGLGVLITRPRKQAEVFAQRLRQQGAQPLVLPTIEIAPPQEMSALQEARAHLADYQFVMFVSANAVEQALQGVTVWPSSVMALAPGPGTAEALLAAGVPRRCLVVPSACFDSEGLLELPLLQNVAGARVLVLRGERGRELLGETLAARGAQVTRVVCYRRLRPEGNADALLPWLQQQRLQALTFTASEALDNFHAMASGAVLAQAQQHPAFVIHPRIAAYAHTLGWQTVLTDSGDDGLIQGMMSYFSSHPPRHA